ncbi:MAG: DnaJ domain-containing protein [Burkholderiales bacterium]|nr:DnaJ domain-containing protein [Burkholderiales bacterium]
MKATLYEALGILPASSDEEVRAALRRVIRKYYAKTRDGQGNVEEALRFINHASRILSDPERRVRYDQELALSAGTTEQRIAHVVSNAVADAGEQTDVDKIDEPQVPKSAEAIDDELETGLDADEPAPERHPHHPGLTERVASFGRSPIVTIVLCIFFGAFIAAAIVFVTPADTVLVAKQVLVWVTITLLGLTLVYAIVHGLAFLRRRKGSGPPALVPQTDLAILNWRREKSVFLGTNQPPEDASWIFQLRMAELERAKSGRTSEARPWQRLAARVFDYAIWGLVLALLLSELRGAGAIAPELAFWLGHPLLAPVLITASFVPIEALLIASIGTTPGKWLFGVFLQFSISDAYAQRDVRTQLKRALRRSLRVWWEGVGCGFPLLAPVLIAIAYEKLAQNQETDWDFAQDVLVTHGPPGILNTVTGVCGLAAMLWLYGVAWHQPMADSIAWARTTIAAAIPSAHTITGGFAGGAGRIASAPHSSGTVGTLPTGTAVTGSPSRPSPAASAPPAASASPPASAARASAPSTLPSTLPVETAPDAPPPVAATAPSVTVAVPPRTGTPEPATPNTLGTARDPSLPLDDDLATSFAERKAKIAVVSVEGPRMLRAGNWRRAAELCKAWTELELASADAYRCLGTALQAQGYHQDAIVAFRKAKHYDPNDRSLDAAIDRSQKGIVAEFLNRYRR